MQSRGELSQFKYGPIYSVVVELKWGSFKDNTDIEK